MNLEQFPKIIENAYFWAVQFGSTYAWRAVLFFDEDFCWNIDHDLQIRLAISSIAPNLVDLVKENAAKSADNSDQLNYETK